MAALVNSRARRSSFLDLFAVELAPREGRVLAVVHIAAASAITVAIAMLFRIPEPTYMAYIVFLISKDEKAATVTTGLGGQIAVTLAIVLSLGLMLIDLSEPALRLPAMAAATFVAMYTARTFVLGPITYLAGFVLVMLQSVVDDVPNPEALTRLSLWLWIVLLVPVVVTVLLNLLFGQSAQLLTERTLKKVLSEMEASLLWGNVPERLGYWREITVTLLGKHLSGNPPAAFHPRITVPAVNRLVDVLVILEALPVNITAAQRSALAKWVTACRRAVEGDPAGLGDDPVLSHGPIPEVIGTMPPSILALHEALRAFHGEIVAPGRTSASGESHAQRHPFAADAFTNPTHWQFALKTTLAVMVVYTIYTLLDWPGMRTSIVTCFFVALGSLGETVHKLTLRVSGALIGGLIAGLCIVFVLPHMTDIGQLSVLIAVVSAGAGWIATSSERLSYAGLQIAFAFFLGILQDYAPATDLTVLRDRVAGIVLGNVAITVIFSLLWPESATSQLRATLAEALRAIGSVIKGGGDPTGARIRTAQALVRADHFEALSSFELSMLPKDSDATTRAPALAAINRLAGAALVATAEPLLPLQDSTSLAAVARWAESAAESTANSSALPQAPPALAVVATSSTSLPSDPLAGIAHRATEELLIEIGNVVTTTL
jgi:multidrug resistance protein MdtO